MDFFFISRLLYLLTHLIRLKNALKLDENFKLKLWKFTLFGH